LAVNPQDELSFRRCVNVPRRAIGDASIKKIRAFAQTNALPLGDTLARRGEIDDLPKLAREGLDQFTRLLDEVRLAAGAGGALGAVDAVTADGEFVRQLLDAAVDDEERQYRQESVDQLRSIAGDHATVESLLDMAGLITEADDSGDDQSRLSLMTIHAAKGLEFGVVFVVGMEEGVFPDRRCVEEGELEEERRLAYVAITRAKRRLYLSHARRRHSFNRVVENDRSRFLDEIPEGLIHFLDVPTETTTEVLGRFAAMRSTLGV
jgi:DNA helicase-2/ATP-dependent DNA helicase PcrA